MNNHRADGPAGKLFRLIRDSDPTGGTGTGHIASGVEWPDGSVTLKWHTAGNNVANVGHYANITNMLNIHGGKRSNLYPYAAPTKVKYTGKTEEPIAAKLLRELSDFAYELGNATERAEKGLAPDTVYLKASYGRILDLAQAAA